MIERYVVRDYTNPNCSRKLNSYGDMKSAVRRVKELIHDDGIKKVWNPDVLAIVKTKYTNENDEQKDFDLTTVFMWSGWFHNVSDLEKMEA